jgi:hypothetical protein
MQSTSNTVSALPMRPKVGRPPPQLPPAEIIALAPPPRNVSLAARRDPRLLAFSVCLVLAMTLVLSRLIAPSMPMDAAAIPPIVVNAPELSAPKAPEPALIGTITTIGTKEEPASYQAKATDREAPAQPAIDKRDRERLLSILSKD